jgi:hypothetical protein
MEAYIGKVGLIIKQACKYVVVEFEDDEAWYYPISLVDEHLVEDEMYDSKFSPLSLTIDNVNHPSHYGGSENKYEAIRVIEAWKSCFHIGNVLKYLSRAGKKGDELEDLKKAMWYLKRKIDLLEGKE